MIGAQADQLKEAQSQLVNVVSLAKSRNALTPGQLAAIESTAADTQKVLSEAKQTQQQFESVMTAPTANAQIGDIYGVIIGGSKDLSIVQRQVDRAKTAGFTDVKMYKIGAVYNNVIVGPTLTQSKEILVKARSIDQYAAGDYLINLGKWCPAPAADSAGTYICR